MTACTITHITAETGRYGGGMVPRFYTEDEEQRKWKTSIKVNPRHVSRTTEPVEKVVVGQAVVQNGLKTPHKRTPNTTEQAAQFPRQRTEEGAQGFFNTLGRPYSIT